MENVMNILATTMNWRQKHSWISHKNLGQSNTHKMNDKHSIDHELSSRTAYNEHSGTLLLLRSRVALSSCDSNSHLVSIRAWYTIYNKWSMRQKPQNQIRQTHSEMIFTEPMRQLHFSSMNLIREYAGFVRACWFWLWLFVPSRQNELCAGRSTFFHQVFLFHSVWSIFFILLLSVNLSVWTRALLLLMLLLLLLLLIGSIFSAVYWNGIFKFNGLILIKIALSTLFPSLFWIGLVCICSHVYSSLSLALSFSPYPLFPNTHTHTLPIGCGRKSSELVITFVVVVNNLQTNDELSIENESEYPENKTKINENVEDSH